MKYLLTYKLFENIDNNRKTLIHNLKFRLNEYKRSILNNIKYDGDNKLIHFDKMDIKSMIRQLKGEATEELFNELNVEKFLNKINNIMTSDKDHLKNRINNEFNKFYKKIDK